MTAFRCPASIRATRLQADLLLAKGRECFSELALPADVEAIWWPRFQKLAGAIIDWERSRADGVKRRAPEARATKLAVGASGVTLSGNADRVDLLPADMADILDYKTGSSPSKGQAHTLLAPQLALEGALLQRGAFRDLGSVEPADLAFVRLKPNGEVFRESILEHNRKAARLGGRPSPKTPGRGWRRLLDALRLATSSRLSSRALPFREDDIDGDYDHLARVFEWSAGGPGEPDE